MMTAPFPLSALNPGGQPQRPADRDHCGCGAPWGERLFCPTCQTHKPGRYGLCPKCSGDLTVPNASSHSCGWGSGFATLSAVGPSELPVEADPKRRAAHEKDLRAANGDFERAVAALHDAIVVLERAWSDVKRSAERGAVVEAILAGRAPASCRDQRLQPERQRMLEGLRRVEGLL
jgi:hypothetical protein